MVVEVVLIEETLRAAGGRTVGVRGLDVEGLEKTGRVLEREIAELGGVARLDLGCCNPVLCRMADWPMWRDRPFGVVLMEGRLSELRDKSHS